MSTSNILIGAFAWLAACALALAFVAGAKKCSGSDDEVQG